MMIRQELVGSGLSVNVIEWDIVLCMFYITWLIHYAGVKLMSSQSNDF